MVAKDLGESRATTASRTRSWYVSTSSSLAGPVLLINRADRRARSADRSSPPSKSGASAGLGLAERAAGDRDHLEHPSGGFFQPADPRPEDRVERELSDDDGF